MMAPRNVVGRLTQLQGLVSKPELNGTYVLIQSYLPETNRFSVRTLPLPNTDDKAVNISVKYESFALRCEINFFDNIPRLKEVPFNGLSDAIRNQPDLTTLKLNMREISQKHTDLVFKKSHRIAGTNRSQDSSNIPDPVTTIRSSVRIWPDYDNEPMLVFEDILFATDNGIVECARTNHTTFRRCSFWNTRATVNGTEKLEVEERLEGFPTAVFESCLFDGNSLQEEQFGALVRHGGTATFLNCVFRNRGAGVSVSVGGKAKLIHCTIENSYNGIELEVKAKGVKVVNCSISNCRMYGISLDQSVSAVITGCRVRDCRDAGILSSGRSGRVNHLDIKDCQVIECRDGMHLNLGKFAARICNTTVSHSVRYGILVGPCAMGSIVANNCNIAHSGERNVMNASQAQCHVTVDGVLQDPTLVEFQPQETLLTLSARRCGHQAGLCDILCDYCERKEEAGEKFKKCGKCENVCYCSRECQKAHWKEHKLVCKLFAMAEKV